MRVENLLLNVWSLPSRQLPCWQYVPSCGVLCRIVSETYNYVSKESVREQQSSEARECSEVLATSLFTYGGRVLVPLLDFNISYYIVWSEWNYVWKTKHRTRDCGRGCCSYIQLPFIIRTNAMHKNNIFEAGACTSCSQIYVNYDNGKVINDVGMAPYKLCMNLWLS